MDTNLIVGIFCSIMFFAFSYLIWNKKQLWLIAGYEKGKIKEENKLAKSMGIFLIISGIYFFILFGFIDNILIGSFAYCIVTVIFSTFLIMKTK